MKHLQVLAAHSYRAPLFARLALCLLLACLTAGGCKREAPPAFDLPTAMGADFHADIDALSSHLGPPQSQSTSDNGLPTRTWQKDGATLTATYKATSKRVVSLSVIARQDAVAVSDEGKFKLLQAAALPENEGSGGYSVEWIEARDRPTYNVGFRIVPSPRTHKVALRISGTNALLTISFQPSTTAQSNPGGSSNAGSGAPFMTLPPWQTTLEAVPDDAKVVLQSRIFKNMDPSGQFSMRAQIEVDGKLVRDQESKGLPLSVDYEL